MMKQINYNSTEVRRYFKFVGLVLLALVSLTALAGSVPMVFWGTADIIGLPLAYLEGTPFHSYRIPGVLLFVLIGLGGIIAFISLLFDFRYHAYTVRGLGIVLLGWIVVHILLGSVHFLHVLIIIIAIALTLIGNYLKRFG